VTAGWNYMKSHGMMIDEWWMSLPAFEAISAE
jgi:hypothetical protein